MTDCLDELMRDLGVNVFAGNVYIHSDGTRERLQDLASSSIATLTDEEQELFIQRALRKD